MSAPNLVKIHPRRASGQTGELQRFYFSSWTNVNNRPLDWFWCLVAQKTQNTLWGLGNQKLKF